MGHIPYCCRGTHTEKRTFSVADDSRCARRANTPKPVYDRTVRFPCGRTHRDRGPQSRQRTPGVPRASVRPGPSSPPPKFADSAVCKTCRNRYSECPYPVRATLSSTGAAAALVGCSDDPGGCAPGFIAPSIVARAETSFYSTRNGSYRASPSSTVATVAIGRMLGVPRASVRPGPSSPPPNFAKSASCKIRRNWYSKYPYPVRASPSSLWSQ